VVAVECGGRTNSVGKATGHDQESERRVEEHTSPTGNPKGRSTLSVFLGITLLCHCCCVSHLRPAPDFSDIMQLQPIAALSIAQLSIL
jgi:hypothetical protein